MKIKKIVFFHFVFLVAFSFALFSCKNKEKEDLEIKNWRETLLKKRAEKDKEFKESPYSPLAGLKRFSVSKEKEIFLYENKNDFLIKEKKDNEPILSIYFRDGKWYWRKFTPAISCKTDEKPIKSNTPLGDEVKCKYKRFHFMVYPLSENLIIIVFDQEKKELKEFKHLYYYPPDPSYRVVAKIQRLKNPEIVEMITSQNQTKKYYRFAKLTFNIKGSKKSLYAYKRKYKNGKTSDWWFIPFKDLTNGKETYPAGRFLEIKEPEGDKVILDFNEAFNPLCNYSHVYNCPYPPYENMFDIEIKAGEKTYPLKH